MNIFAPALYNVSRRCMNSSLPAIFSSLSRSFSKETGIVNIQDAADFKEKVLNNEHPVVVDFHATWCGPCKMLGPRLESVMTNHIDKVLLAKIDVDDMEDLALQYNVTAVPTVVGIKAGKEVARFAGLKEEAQVEKFIQEFSK